MMKYDRIELLIGAAAVMFVATPAFADFVPPGTFPAPGAAPAPIAGLGYGAFVAVGIGYRALKRRIGR